MFPTMYGVSSSSDTISRDMSSVLCSSTFKHPADGEFAKIKQLISSGPSYPNYSYHNQNQIQLQQQQQMEIESDARNFLQYGPLPAVMKEEKERDDRKQDLPPSTPAKVNDARRERNLSPSSNGSSYGYGNRRNSDCVSSFRGRDPTSRNLVSQSSTPAGFLSSLSAENGVASMKKGSSSSTMNNHISYSLESSSSPSRFLPQIAENKNELQDSTSGSLKRSRDGVLKMPQNVETGNHTPNLVHHMSLPKTSSEMAVVENVLQFQQDSTVPWKIRAKRGCATHPRSIAERVRRTRISERIKRLQELFPDIDKQSNTADMLDMAVEHIKNLQKELQTLNDARARCKCSSKQLRST